jgi:mRNA-degrading endonuclease RelE of RelBE toxin-antitoxin system
VCIPKLSSDALKYLNSLDRTTAKRITEKITALAYEPYNLRLSKPLKNSNKRTARVGDYRILFVVEAGFLLVSFIGPRGQIYRNA